MKSPADFLSTEDKDYELHCDPNEVITPWSKETRVVLTNFFFMCRVSEMEVDSKEKDLNVNCGLIAKHIRFILEQIWLLLMLNGVLPYASKYNDLRYCDNYPASCKDSSFCEKFKDKGPAEKQWDPNFYYNKTTKKLSSGALKIITDTLWLSSEHKNDREYGQKMLKLWEFSCNGMHSGNVQDDISFADMSSLLDQLLDIAGWTLEKLKSKA